MTAFSLSDSVAALASWIWGIPLVLLITLSGLYFFVISALLPIRKLPNAFTVISGRYDAPNAPGSLTHFKALSVSMASTIGMGNIAGVALAISIGGPGVIFWMWVTAFLGMATKFFTCSLAVMYRGYDANGELQGGPMYVIREALGPRFLPLAWLFCGATMIGCLPIFNANQLTSAFQTVVLAPQGIDTSLRSNALIGGGLLTISGVVILGGLHRIATAAASIVSVMVIVYFLAVMGILIKFSDQMPSYIALIFTDAFAAEFYKGESFQGGVLGGLILLGVRRAAFSNEAGLGTAAMAHGAAKTDNPTHEGLVAMLGPVIDTLIVCTLTGLAILVTGVWQQADGLQGIGLTLRAFEAAYPQVGMWVLLACILAFGISSLFSYAYYGQKCASFLAGPQKAALYIYAYLFSILLGAMFSINLAINIIDIGFALMAVPTLISTLLLAPRVTRETRLYFSNKMNV